MAKDKDKEEKATKGDGKLEKIVKAIEELSVLELADLVKALQEKFGVSAVPQAAPAATPAGSTAVAEGPAEPAEEQTTFNVILANSGANKISVIKALREINPQQGLKDAKDIADAPPKEILTGVNKTAAEEAKQKLEAAGATVELK
ncbi:50S ribosomal protein L7/L12 [Candidatus Curtissbacteria bacterium RBG_16_39_7]|uniref:Large ribosomal subunit protein bL12 n=1 Tax=Candidatus Curtissbacteria bacterium RBG_16_39_7 TaxID=1797707 RepID=A0A1F5G4H7_9BACT|nr:MAG: 50S ribosomal protein L7/L12 [Candidatus Curtissbacteria bacterium RBG_16_39_7]